MWARGRPPLIPTRICNMRARIFPPHKLIFTLVLLGKMGRSTSYHEHVSRGYRKLLSGDSAIDRKKHDERWEGGIDHDGVLLCHYGRGKDGRGCMSEQSCVIPQSRGQKEHCMKEVRERPFLGKYEQSWSTGVYKCGCCNASLFKSADKFDSGAFFEFFHFAPCDSLQQ